MTRNGVDQIVEVLGTLWPEGIPPLDYRNLLRVIRIVEDTVRESAKTSDSLSSAQDGQWQVEQWGGRK